MIGRTISHYRILEMLGQGGMGEVYKAEDTLLDRVVAIKVLRLDLQADADGQDRLVREAQAAGRLAHPNIATIHDFLDEGGQRFIVMEYLPGRTLASRILERPLPMTESLDIALGIGAGLDHAHRRGVLHRDLKPENVILSEDGTSKILDFGLALLTDRSRITREGMSLGTAAYVSPEQARGDPQDERTDIWSLGVVLYEMVAGRRPFKGENPLIVLYQVQNEEPEPLTAVRSDVPMELERIVDKALRKDCAERYLHVADLLVDLKTLRARLAATPVSGGRSLPAPARRSSRGRILGPSIGAGALVFAALLLALQLFNRAAGAIDSLAVLPLANAAPDTASEYLGEGISENLINSLSQLPRLKVIARSSAFEFRGLHRDARSIGRKLGVRAVLLGDVLEHAGRIRISAELVDVRDDRHLWGAEYDRPAGDLLAVQEEISRSISESLRLKLSGENREQLARHDTENPQAYQFYLKGKYYWEKQTNGALFVAADCYRQAIARDPAYARAYCGLANVYANLSVAGFEPEKAMELSRSYARKALDLDGKIAEGHVSMGIILAWHDWNWTEAEREFRRAIELNPGLVDGRSEYAYFLLGQKRVDEAEEQLQIAQSSDPLNLAANTYLGAPPFYRRNFPEAITRIQKVVDMDPTFAWAHFWIGFAEEQQQRLPEAKRRFQEAYRLGGDPLGLAMLGRVYGLEGKADSAQLVLDMLKSRFGKSYLPPFAVAKLYTGLANKDKVIEYLSLAADRHDMSVPWIYADPDFADLRGDPRFQALLRRMGLIPGKT